MKYEGTKIVYEVGDFVTRIDGEHLGMNVGDADRIYGFDEYSNQIQLTKYIGVNSRGCHTRNLFRISSQEEINKATEEEKIMVGEYEVEYYKVEGSRPHTIKVGCVKVPEELFKKIGKKAGWL